MRRPLVARLVLVSASILWVLHMVRGDWLGHWGLLTFLSGSLAVFASKPLAWAGRSLSLLTWVGVILSLLVCLLGWRLLLRRSRQGQEKGLFSVMFSSLAQRQDSSGSARNEQRPLRGGDLHGR